MKYNKLSWALSNVYEISEEEADNQFKRGTWFHTCEFEYAAHVGGTVIKIRAFGAHSHVDDVVCVRFYLNGKFIGRNYWYCHRNGREWRNLPKETFYSDLYELPQKLEGVQLSDNVIYLKGSEELFDSQTGYGIDLKKEKLVELNWFETIDLAEIC